MIVIIIWLFCIIIFSFLVYHVVRYRNPFKLYMVFGGKGSGKTTLLTKLAWKAAKQGRPVYSTVPVPGVPVARVFDVNDFGRFMFPAGSLVLIDEVGLIWDNRQFKNFRDDVKSYFKYQRQYQNTVYLFSQAFDVDKKIRDLTDHIYICQNYFNFLSIARRVTKHITIVHADKSSQGESKIADDYSIDPLLFAFFGSVIFTYIPRWAKMFKSFDPPALPDMEYSSLVSEQDEALRTQRRTLVGAVSKLRSHKIERIEFLNKLNRKIFRK